MAEAAESASADAKTSRQPRLRYEDRPDVGETFADSIRSCVFDGQLMRIEFTVARFDDPSPLGIIEGRQVPVCRLVLNRTALADLFNRVGQLGAALTKAGVTVAPPKPASEPQKDGKARK